MLLQLLVSFIKFISHKNKNLVNNSKLCKPVNNTNAMIGRKKSIVSRFKKKNESSFIGGSPCHLANIAAGNANDAFSSILDSMQKM